jgi:hypothetical protein
MNILHGRFIPDRVVEKLVSLSENRSRLIVSHNWKWLPDPPADPLRRGPWQEKATLRTYVQVRSECDERILEGREIDSAGALS